MTIFFLEHSFRFPQIYPILLDPIAFRNQERARNRHYPVAILDEDRTVLLLETEDAERSRAVIELHAGDRVLAPSGDLIDCDPGGRCPRIDRGMEAARFSEKGGREYLFLIRELLGRMPSAVSSLQEITQVVLIADAVSVERLTCSVHPRTEETYERMGRIAAGALDILSRGQELVRARHADSERAGLSVIDEESAEERTEKAVRAGIEE